MRFRQPRSTFAALLVSLPGGLNAYRLSGDPLWLAFLVVLAVACTWSLRFGVTLTAEALVVEGLRRRTVAWSDILAIEHTRTMGVDGIRVWTADASLRLRAPVGTLLGKQDRFWVQFHQLGQWWLAHRGPQWRPGGLTGG